MWRLLLFGISVSPLSAAEPQSFHGLVDDAVRHSGVWEARVDLGPAETGFAEKITGLILNVETQVEGNTNGSWSVRATETLTVEWENAGLSPSSMMIYRTESRQAQGPNVFDARIVPLHLDVDPGS